jgi:phosphoribosylanthranilate isomerase
MGALVVQIYEIQTPAEAEAVVALGVDHVGSVILSEAGWKNDILRQTLALVAASPAKSSLIPLFHTPDTVMRALDYYRPDMVHFCDAVGNAQAGDGALARMIDLQELIRQRFPQLAVMRSIPIGPPGHADVVHTVELGRRFAPISDWLLTDTLLVGPSAGDEAPQPVNGFIGITGKTCDWAMARKLVESVDVPVILAGGISAENVAAGVRQVAPAGVDSCTLTNATDERKRSIRFRKDPQKVAALVQIVRRLEREDQEACTKAVT